MRTNLCLLLAAAGLGLASLAACNATPGNEATQAGNEAESANAAGTVDAGGAPSAAPANVAVTAAVGELVPFRGCPIRAGVAAGCITVKSDGVTYELYSAKPLPDPSKYLIVDGQGTSGGTVSNCQAGTPLTNVEWTYTKMKCG